MRPRPPWIGVGIIATGTAEDVGEVDVVENVEGFRAELRGKPFAELKFLGDREVPYGGSHPRVRARSRTARTLNPADVSPLSTRAPTSPVRATLYSRRHAQIDFDCHIFVAHFVLLQFTLERRQGDSVNTVWPR